MESQKENDENFGPYWTTPQPGKFWSWGCALVRTIPFSRFIRLDPPGSRIKRKPAPLYSWPEELVPCPLEPARCNCGFLLADCIIWKPECRAWDGDPKKLVMWTLRFPLRKAKVVALRSKQGKLFGGDG